KHRPADRASSCAGVGIFSAVPFQSAWSVESDACGRAACLCASLRETGSHANQPALGSTIRRRAAASRRQILLRRIAALPPEAQKLLRNRNGTRASFCYGKPPPPPSRA